MAMSLSEQPRELRPRYLELLFKYFPSDRSININITDCDFKISGFRDIDCDGLELEGIRKVRCDINCNINLYLPTVYLRTRHSNPPGKKNPSPPRPSHS